MSSLVGKPHLYGILRFWSALVIVASCLRFSIVALDKSAYKAMLVKGSGSLAARFAAYMTLSLTVKKWIRAKTSLGVEGGRWDGLGSLCARSISKSWAVRSGTRVRIRDCKNCTSSGCWTDSGTLWNLMLLRLERSSRSASFKLINWSSSSWSENPSTSSLCAESNLPF